MRRVKFHVTQEITIRTDMTNVDLLHFVYFISTAQERFIAIFRFYLLRHLWSHLHNRVGNHPWSSWSVGVILEHFGGKSAFFLAGIFLVGNCFSSFAITFSTCRVTFIGTFCYIQPNVRCRMSSDNIL